MQTLLNHLALLSSFHPASSPPSPSETRDSSPAASIHQNSVTRDREIDPSRIGQALNAVHSIGILARQPISNSASSQTRTNEPLRLAQSALQRLVTASTTSDALVVAGLRELALIAETLVLRPEHGTTKVGKEVKEEFREIGRTVGAVGRGAVLHSAAGSGANGARNGDASVEGSDAGMGKEEAVFKAVSLPPVYNVAQ